MQINIAHAGIHQNVFHELKENSILSHDYHNLQD